MSTAVLASLVPVLKGDTGRALRFLTAGSVDDGKSTLIGRLLLDSQALLADQVSTLTQRAAGTVPAAGGPAFDLSLLTDGLEAEREQGITIDVAWRYFATKQRKFIIADAPGHEQYTRNMVTAAAGSDAAVVLVDVTKINFSAQPLQLLPQTRRHALLAHLLRVPSIVFAVNKLDAVADPGPAFAAVQVALRAFAAEAGMSVAAIVPVSALRGDNVATPLNAAWHAGPSLLQVLERLPAGQPARATGLRLPVQYVARPAHEGRGMGDEARTLWGRVAQGQVAVGDEVQVFPSGERAVVAALRNCDGMAESVGSGLSAGVVLDRQLDVSRGDWLGTPGLLQPVQRVAATLAWLDVEPATPGRKYLLRHGHRWVQARLDSVQARLDIHSLQATPADSLAVNEIGEVVFELQHALPLVPYAHNAEAGSLIVVDPASHRTSGALLVRGDAGAAP
jgi:sulfate adenylyltransferase subunit 1